MLWSNGHLLQCLSLYLSTIVRLPLAPPPAGGEEVLCLRLEGALRREGQPHHQPQRGKRGDHLRAEPPKDMVAVGKRYCLGGEMPVPGRGSVLTVNEKVIL